MSVRYELHTLRLELDKNTVTVYGINCRSSEDGIIRAQGICADKDKIKSLVALMNKLELSPIHFRDVIDDFLLQET